MDQIKKVNGTISLSPTINIKNETLELETIENINGFVVNRYKEITNLKDKVIRDALIAMGWTPPSTLDTPARPPEDAKLCATHVRLASNITQAAEWIEFYADNIRRQAADNFAEKIKAWNPKSPEMLEVKNTLLTDGVAAIMRKE